jgi:hypothetical protein
MNAKARVADLSELSSYAVTSLTSHQPTLAELFLCRCEDSLVSMGAAR